MSTNHMNLVLCRPFESQALSRSVRQPSIESRIRRLEKFKVVLNGNITNNEDIVFVCLRKYKSGWASWDLITSLTRFIFP